MLSLTRKAEYGLIALCHLAKVRPRTVSARDLAEQYGLPLPLLMNVLKTLNQAGLVSSARGVNGGYRLEQSAEDISLADLIDAVEGPFRLVRCIPADGDGSHEDCELEACCQIKAPVARLHDRLRKFLEMTTIGEIASGEIRSGVETKHNPLGILTGVGTLQT